jgi:tight adherence protein B
MITSSLPFSLPQPLLIVGALVLGPLLLVDWYRRASSELASADADGRGSSTGLVEADDSSPDRVPRAWLVRAGLEGVTARDFVLFSLACGLGCGALAQTAVGWGAFSLFASGLGLLAPFAYYAHRRERRLAAWRTALADAVDQLRDAIRTGLSVEDGLAGLASTGPAALRPELRRLVREQRALGLAPALEAMRRRVADSAFDAVAVTLTVNDRLGSQRVGLVLDQLARTIRVRLRVREEVRAAQARNVASARLIAAVPLALLVVVRRLNPEYVALFDTGWGHVLLAVCLVAVALGYAAMRRMARLPDDRRVLA